MKAPAKRRKYGLNVWKAHLKIDAMQIEAMYDGSIVKEICTGTIGNNWKEIKRKILNRKRREKFIGSRFFLSVKDYGLLRTLKRETKRVERAEGLRRRSGCLGCFFF